jgi:hypothetical protein
MEAFLENLKVILPVVGLDLLKPKVLVTKPESVIVGNGENLEKEVRFEIRHKSGVKPYAIEVDGEFVVLPRSEAVKEPGYARNSYAGLKEDLIHQGTRHRESHIYR